MAVIDGSLRGQRADLVFVDEARELDWNRFILPDLPEIDWRSQIAGHWHASLPPARGWWSVTPPETEPQGSALTIEALRNARRIIEQRGEHMTATEIERRVEERRAMINRYLTEYGIAYPPPKREEKIEIKRGNPWLT